MQRKRAQSNVFDIEIEGDEVGATHGGGHSAPAGQVLVQLLSECNSGGSTPEQAQLFRDAQEARALAAQDSCSSSPSPSSASGADHGTSSSSSSSGSHVNLEAFARLLALRGNLVWLRTGRPDCGCAGQVSLRHTFVLAGVPAATAAGGDVQPSTAAPAPQLYVVDPCFRDSFQLPNATPAYAAMWEALPALFVGTAAQLVPLVEVMCEQMQLVFAESSASFPPWRTATCMLTKWLPSSADDVPVVAQPANSSGASDTSTHTCGGSSSASSVLAGGSSASPRSASAARQQRAQPAAATDALCEVASVTLLPPIRTGLAAGAADGEGVGGRSPASARSPLYYDHEQHGKAAALAGLLSPWAPALSSRHLLQAHYPLVGAGSDRDGLTFRGDDTDGSAFAAAQAAVPSMVRRCSSDGLQVQVVGGSAVVSVGSWGDGSNCSSPGIEAPAGALRSFLSEDCYDRVCGGGGVGVARRRGVAIVHQARGAGRRCGVGGFGEAVAAGSAAREAAAAVRFSPAAAGPALAGRSSKAGGVGAGPAAHAAAAAGARDSAHPGSCRATPPSRSLAPCGHDATLDLARFDSGGRDDALGPAPGLALFGGLGLGGGSSSGSTQQHAAGPAAAAQGAPLPPAAVRRLSSNSSMCSQRSALSAAIAGKGVPVRR